MTVEGGGRKLGADREEKTRREEEGQTERTSDRDREDR